MYPVKNDLIDTQREKNLQNLARGGKLPITKVCRRQEIMENFRMRILRNLDLAIDIIIEEG